MKDLHLSINPPCHSGARLKLCKIAEWLQEHCPWLWLTLAKEATWLTQKSNPWSWLWSLSRMRKLKTKDFKKLFFTTCWHTDERGMRSTKEVCPSWPRVPLFTRHNVDARIIFFFPSRRATLACLQMLSVTQCFQQRAQMSFLTSAFRPSRGGGTLFLNLL